MNEGSLEEMMNCAEHPHNCFDKMLSDHKGGIRQLSPRQLRFLLDARENCEKLNAFAHFTRQDLTAGVKDGVFSPDGAFAKVYNDLLIAETFFK